MPMSEVEPFLKSVYTDKILEQLKHEARLMELLCPDTRTEEQKAADRAEYERVKFATKYWIV